MAGLHLLYDYAMPWFQEHADGLQAQLCLPNRVMSVNIIRYVAYLKTHTKLGAAETIGSVQSSWKATSHSAGWREGSWVSIFTRSPFRSNSSCDQQRHPESLGEMLGGSVAPCWVLAAPVSLTASEVAPGLPGASTPKWPLHAQEILVPHSSSLGLDRKTRPVFKYSIFMDIPGRSAWLAF